MLNTNIGKVEDKTSKISSSLESVTFNSIRQIINANGDVQNLYTYDPFGNHLEQDETIDNRFRFAGYKYDPLTGGYDCNARWV